jgi:NAD(P)-dependent dehydrogenase (short-subunit alcohol dehydrogenase family)
MTRENSEKDRNVILITGASRGIGRAAAEYYIREGWHVIALSKSASALESLDDYAKSYNNKVTITQLDLKEAHKIPEFMKNLSERFSRLDALIGNAGMLGQLMPMVHQDIQELGDILTVNFLSNLNLLKYAEPMLSKSEHPRAVFVTSGVTQTNPSFWGGYTISKLALEKMVELFSKESATHKLKVNLLDPGVVATRMRSQAMPGEDPTNLTSPETIAPLFDKLTSRELRHTGEIFYASEMIQNRG